MGVFQIIVPFCIIVVTFLLKYSVQYKELSLENDDLCSLIKKRKIRLYKDDHSALLVTQNQLKRHSIDWATNFRCKFEVQSAFHDGGGIMAVIQLLDLRRNHSTGECIDYVQFTKKDGINSQRFCGKFTAAERMNLTWDNAPGFLAKDAAFIDEKGEMDVFIYVSRKATQHSETTEIFIAFTSYKSCSINTGPPDRLNLRPCKPANGQFCMFKDFKNDDIINCPYTECVDLPGGCPVKPSSQSNNAPSGESIFYGALSSLFITFAIFVCCIMVLRARHLLCFGDRCTNPQSRSNPSEQSNRVIELGESPMIAPQPPQPHSSTSAPPLEEDKDLPPSYDSLFPSISAR